MARNLSCWGLPLPLPERKRLISGDSDRTVERTFFLYIHYYYYYYSITYPPPSFQTNHHEHEEGPEPNPQTTAHE